MTDGPIFTDELRGKVDVFMASIVTEPPATDADVAKLMSKAGIAIVDTSRRQALVDLTVHEGVLWRLAELRRQHPPRLIVKPETWRGLAP